MAKVIKTGKFKINGEDYNAVVISGIDMDKACELCQSLRELETDERFTYVTVEKE